MAIMHAPEVITILEFALRCHGIEKKPKSVDDLPLPVIHTLQSVCQTLQYEHLNIYKENGVTNLRNASWHNYDQDHAIPGGSGETHGEFWSRIYDCAHGKIDLALLDAHYLAEWEVAEWYLGEGLPLPEFWFSPAKAEDYRKTFLLRNTSTTESNESVKPRRPDQQDRLICQAIGLTLWDIHPTMTIADMIKQNAIQKYGNGAQYKGKDTLRNWLSEVAPEAIKGRRGRPKKNPSQ